MISAVTLPVNCIGTFPFFLAKWITVQIMNAVIPVMKMPAIMKMKRKALSTPSARFDAPENIVVLS
jgi:hypothetical protein